MKYENNLFQLRTEANMTQDNLSELSGISKRTIQYIEKGQRDVTVTTALIFSKIFNCTVEDIFDYNTKQER